MDLLLSIVGAYLLFVFVVMPLALVILGAVRDLCMPFVNLYRWIVR